MSNGLEDPRKADGDLLEYSDNITIGSEAVNEWRALTNLVERMALLRLHAHQIKRRYPELSNVVGNACDRLAEIESALETHAVNATPDRSALSAPVQSETGSEINMNQFDRRADWNRRVINNYRRNGGMVEIEMSSGTLDDVLDGFHYAEANGRWTGPSTTAVFHLPLGALKALGAVDVIVEFDHMVLTDMDAIRFLAGPELLSLPTRDGPTGPAAKIDISGVTQSADRLIISTMDTRRLGADPRFLGAFVKRVLIQGDVQIDASQ